MGKTGNTQTSKESNVGDFDVIQVMAKRGAGLRASTIVGGIQKGKDDKLGRVTMGLENEHCQEIMKDMMDETGKYKLVLLVIESSHFDKVESELRKREGN